MNRWSAILALGCVAAAAIAPAAAASPGGSALAVKVIVYDHTASDRLATVSVGQVIDIQLDVSGSDDDQFDFEDTGRICVVQGPCSKIGFATTGYGLFWTIRVKPSMIVNKRLTIEVTWKDETVTTRTLPLRTFTKPPRAYWDKVGFDAPILICFGAYVPPRFSARLRVAHSWRDANKRLVREKVRTVRFSFAPSKGFVTPTYRGRAYREKAIDEYCLDVSPTLRGVGERVGFFTFTYIYRGKSVSSARYKYVIERTRTHLAKEGSDDYFNYCLKEAPGTIFSSGGVLMCSVPGHTLIVYGKQ